MRKNLREERLGEQVLNVNGEITEIIEYNNAGDILVEFKDSGYKVRCSYRRFKSGKLKNKLNKTVYGVGCIGDTTIILDGRKKKKSFQIWEGMIHRCYATTEDTRIKSYEKCSVCDEWLCYANFEKWYDENYYEIDNEIMCIDKDILIKDNTIYRPDACIIVPEKINHLVCRNKQNRTDLPIGVYYRKDKVQKHFMAQLSTSDGRKVKKCFCTAEEAFLYYKEKKEETIKRVADEYKNKIPQKLYDALYAYEVEITD